MDLFDAIFTRRSIRKFTGEPVSEEQLALILRAGSYAPSAHNHQPWHFVVVRDCDTLEAIAAGHPYAKMLPQAGCCIVVCGDKERQGMTGFLVEDCSAAIQNMLLAAHGSGLGAVWCGLYPVPRLTRLVSKLLQLPKHVIPVGMIGLGHKLEDRQTGERFDPARVHQEKW
jgi:nitroreductase